MNIISKLANKFSNGSSLYARSTPGGINPKAHKQNSLRSKIMGTPLPSQLSIPFAYNDDSTVEPMVKIGDRVLKYQKLTAKKTREADGESNHPAFIPTHSPTSGTVLAIEQTAVADNITETCLCIKLSVDGEDEAEALVPISDYQQVPHSYLLLKLADAGLAGMGGAGFPSIEKLNSSLEHGTELLIINAAECEPYITADEALIREHPVEVITGAAILKRSSKAKRCIIAIEESKKDAIATLTQALVNTELEASEVEIIIIETKYPSGGEKQLIQCLTGIEIPSGMYPSNLGITVLNAGTSYAAYKAVVEGKPCISRITTLTGDALQTPKNFEVLLGTATAFLFDLCGLREELKTKSIIGGSLMGRILPSDEAVVSKTSNCLIAGTDEEFPASRPEQACIRCGFCANVCPASLLPQQLYAFSKSKNNEQLLEYGLLDCIECGACDYVCPSNIPLVSYYRDSKSEINNRKSSLAQSQQWQQRFQCHQYRSKKDKDESIVKKSIAKNQPPENAITRPIAAKNIEQEFFSKEEASREIAAAVARVKTRRSKTSRKDRE